MDVSSGSRENVKLIKQIWVLTKDGTVFIGGRGVGGILVWGISGKYKGWD